MVDISISCDTFVRLASVITGMSDDIDRSFHHIRLENGCAIVSDRRFMAIECIGQFEGMFYIRPDAALIEQCRTEANFNGKLTLTPSDMLQYTTAKTSLGYVHPASVGFWSPPSDFDKWKQIVAQTKTPATESHGPMFWEADGLARLAASSPSKAIVFEMVINTARPTIVRDMYDHNWIGVFNPFPKVMMADGAAVIPSWLIV